MKASRAVYRRAVLPLLETAGFFAILRRVQRSRALVVMYHGVASNENGEMVTNANHVDEAEFRWQLNFLKEHYTVVSLREIVDRLRRGASLTGLAAITFDDGYESVYRYAAPSLLQLGLPATVFLITGLVGVERLTWYDAVERAILSSPARALSCLGRAYDLQADRAAILRQIKATLKTVSPAVRDHAISRLNATLTVPFSVPAAFSLMSWDQVRDLQHKGIEFGVHSATHPNLSTVPEDELNVEITEAARVLAERLSVPIDHLCFSYPDGDYTQTIRDHVQRSRLAGAVTVDERLVSRRDDPFTIPRVGLYRNYSHVMVADSFVGFTRSLKRATTRADRFEHQEAT